ncbi:translocation/assembly module TamB domain-containing protein [Marimonas lutisalis]|uniref:translocation/assembly module TamB domain-containing protein n=1 Tax=Marimonas lutisalis TaxID=2545756 RepID=UPI0010F7D9CD|nr:translocation/assembly module TamB domain-containing protein [Marimonas lutisalis]
MRVLFFLICFFVPLAALAQDEQSDRGYIQGLLEDALSAPGRTVRLEGFEGALSARATIKRVTVTDPQGVWFSASDVVLIWNRSALLRGRIDIQEITVGQIDLPRPTAEQGPSLPSPEARGEFALPELPVSVAIEKMEIKQAKLGEAFFGKAASLAFAGKADLAAGSGNASLEVKRLDQPGMFRFVGGFDKTERVLAIDLNLSEPEDGIAANLLNLPGKPSLALVVSGKDPISDFKSSFSLSTDGRERLEGGVEIVPEQDGATRFSAAMSGDLAPVLAPELHDFLGSDLKLVAEGRRAADGAVVLEDLQLQTQAMEIRGAAELANDGWPESFTLDGTLTPPSGERVLLPLPDARISLRSAEFFARFDAKAGDAWQINGTVKEWKQQGLQIDAAAVAASGSILRDARSVSGAVQIQLDGFTPAEQVIAQAVGEQLRGRLKFGWTRGAPLRVRDIALEGADYGLRGVTTISGLEGLGALAILPELRLEARDLSRFAGVAGFSLSGRAQLSARGQVQPLTGRISLALNGATQDITTGFASLDPLLSGAGALEMKLDRDEAGLRVRPFMIATDHARIEADADLRTDRGVVSASATLPDVTIALPDLRGAAEVAVEARQNGDVWTVDIGTSLPGETRAEFRGLVEGNGLDRLTTSGEVTARVARVSAFSEVLHRRVAGEVDLTADISADLLKGSYDLVSTGQAKKLDLSIPTLKPVLGDRVQFDISVARGDNSRIAVRQVAVSSPAATATAQGWLAGGAGEFEYSLGLGNLSTVIPDLSGPARFSGRASRQGQTWQVAASGSGPAGITFETAGGIAQDGSRVDLRVNGKLPLALANARLRGQALSGVARIDATVNGPLALSSVSGSVNISDARFADPARYLAFDRIRGQINLSGARAQTILEADVASGGTVRVSGPISLSAPYQASLEAELIDVTLRQPAFVEATMAGSVTVDGPLQGNARIGGAIAVQSAELRIPQFGPSYSALEGLRHLNPPRAVQRTLRYSGLDQETATDVPMPDFPLDLRISAPSRIFVRGRGLDAELGGSLRLTGSTNNIVPIGRFELIRGRLDVLARRLVLTEGSVTMRGSFDPYIAFAATSQVDDVSVALRLEGVASQPQLTVSSVPELPQEEALSYFLFGRDATRISAFQAVQLAAAIATLSGQSIIDLTSPLRESLGVDDLDLSTDEGGTTQARVGKYISDKAYTDVTVKSDGTSQINLNIEVSPTVKMRGRLGSDGDSGIGIFFEKDY